VGGPGFPNFAVNAALVRREKKSIRDIVVIGAPVGGGAALAHLASAFPPNLEASLFVVLHATPQNPILLADILNAPGRMRAAGAIHGEPIERRRIYVAAEGRHLRMRDGKVNLSPNGAENPHRSSIDILFASAAETFNRRVIGVLLLHAREDGAPGLQAIRAAGGRTITQRNKQMPEAPKHPETGETLAHHHLALAEIAPCVIEYVGCGNGG
jgi:two-component system, chemotaxis family, protein-glutamate methylesterase/glutaminase